MDIFQNFNKKATILITGGAGFIGSAVIRRLLIETDCRIFNIDKMGYASDLSSIKRTLLKLGLKHEKRHKLLKVDLRNSSAISSAIEYSNPDLIMHLAAESHVDRSINNPEEFMMSNILGTFNLLEGARKHFEKLPFERKKYFRFHHISTDEVFGTVVNNNKFNEHTRYYPRSPYSASKASSDHLVNSWHHTYGLPTLITNCSNNYGPWQYTEKLIPKIIFNAINNNKIPIYGDGSNIRDWLFVEDHVDGLLKVLKEGIIGESYCIGGNEEKSNNEVVNIICEILDKKVPQKNSYKQLINYVEDRLGHDKRYSIDTSKIKSELSWEPKYSFQEAIDITVSWYINKFK